MSGTGSGHRTPDNDDTFIPEPMYFARALGWTKGWSRAWSWLALTETAGELYWQRRPRLAVEDINVEAAA